MLSIGEQRRRAGINSSLQLGQYIPVESAAHGWDARSKIIAVVGLSISIIAASYWLQAAVVGMVILVLLGLSRIASRFYLINLRLLLVLAAVTALLQLLAVPGRVVYTIVIVGLTVTWEGLIAGGWLFFRITGVLLLAAWLTFTTRPGELTAGLERLLAPLRCIRFPVQELVMIMTLSLRFLPLIAEEANQIQRAQMVRGVNWSKGSLRQKGHYVIALIVPLLRLSLQRAEDLAEAMENRGYQAGITGTRLYPQPLQVSDWLLIAVTGIVLVLQFI